MKKSLLLIACICFAGILFSQPNNDNACSATLLVGNGTGCTMQAGTNVGATASSGVPAPGCGAYTGADVWYLAVVPPSGVLYLATNAGTMSNGAMAIYSGTCSALTLIKCNDDSLGLMPVIYKTGLAPGDTIYVRMFGNNGETGSFTICGNVNSGIEEINGESFFTIAPNPFTSQTTITFREEQKNTTIKIMNPLGQCVQQLITNSKQLTIDMNGYAKGIYFVEITNEKKNVFNRKISIQ